MNLFSLTPLRLALLAALTPAPALACPTMADVEGMGVTLAFDDGFEMMLLRREDGVVEQRIEDSAEAGVTHLAEYLDGIFYLGGGRLIDGGHRSDPVTARYSSPIPEIAAGDAYAVTLYVTVEDVETAQDLEIRIGQAEQIEIGECSYAALPVGISQLVEGNPYETRSLFIPELGIGFAIGADVFDGEPEVYTPVRIVAAGG